MTNSDSSIKVHDKKYYLQAVTEVYNYVLNINSWNIDYRKALKARDLVLVSCLDIKTLELEGDYYPDNLPIQAPRCISGQAKPWSEKTYIVFKDHAERLGLGDDIVTHNTGEFVSTWIPETDKQILAAIAKLGEECSELTKVCFRVVMQGINGVDPKTGESNMLSLRKELADVKALSTVVQEFFDLNESEFESRVEEKIAHKKAWIKQLT